MGAGDRITYDDDGASLDEIVVEGATFHMERMSHHGWWIGVTRDDGTSLRICWNATNEPLVEQDGERFISPESHGPLLYHEGSLWTDEAGSEHRCEVGSGDLNRERMNAHRHRKCRCECGATRWRRRT